MSTRTVARKVARSDWERWSCDMAVAVTDPAVLAEARHEVELVLDAVEHAASRFRPDSELSRLTVAARDRELETEVSPLLADLLGHALAMAAATRGAVDPTVGATLSDLGYDRDLREVRTIPHEIGRLHLDGDRPRVVVRPVPGWRRVALDGTRLRLSGGVVLDLGATAKARAADLAAARAHARTGVGVLVELGGDIATAGPAPDGGWQVLVRDGGPAGSPDPGTIVSLPGGQALATSSIARRTWRRDGEQRHHLIDPRTHRPARTPWTSVSVVTPTCLAANACATAALVMGTEGLAWLQAQGVPARVVAPDAEVVRLGGWPAEVRPLDSDHGRSGLAS